MKRFLILLVFFLVSCLKQIDIPKENYQLTQFFLLSYPNLEIKIEKPYINEGQNQKILLRLTAQPMDTVKIPIFVESSLLQINPNSLVFTQESWETFQEIQIVAPEDPYYEPNQKISLSFGPYETSDYLYNGKMNAISYSYTNNDPLGFSVSWGSPTEGAPSVSLSISLYSRPKCNVTVSIENPASSQMSFSSSSVTFTPGNWNLNQSVNITAIDDTDLEYNQTYIITLVASGCDAYNGYKQDIPITVIDNDVPGFEFSPNWFSIVEGGNQNIGIRLFTSPTSNVTVSITSSPTSVCTITSGSSLTFDNTNYSTYQYFTIQAKSADDIDNLNESSPNCTITATASSSDPLYNGLTSNLLGYIYDFRSAGINVSTFPLPTISESGTSTTFTIQLSSQPTNPVKICIKSSNYCEAYIDSTGINAPNGSCTSYAGANTPYVIFNSGNWNTPQIITVKARHDWDFRNSGSIPETGGQCNPPYPDGNKVYSIDLHTICSGCNSMESTFYNTGTTTVPIFLSGSVQDDLDLYSYVTSATHDGNFSGDGSLSGTNAIQKADSFCSSNNPGLPGTYKALIVDGTNRQANPTTIDWVLQPNKFYFRNTDNQLMFKTDATPYFIFSDPDSNGAPSSTSYWTGLIGATWNTNVNTCLGWTTNLSASMGQGGSGGFNDSNSIDSTISVTCDSTKGLLCIQQ